MAGAPKKLYARLCEQGPTTRWPQPSTIGDILDRHGLVEMRARRRATAAPFRRVFEPRAVGDVMTVDFKGQFRTRDGQLVLSADDDGALEPLSARV